MWVKICGITRYEDALAAVDLGADAIGFVLTDRSRRRADSKSLREWIRYIQGVEKVGVFLDEDPVHIVRLGTELGLDTVQIHSEIGPEHMPLYERFHIIYAMKVFRQDMLPDIDCRLIIDPSTGSGKKGAWKRLPIPYILAGGLAPDNVRKAIRQACPTGVDVSSGVESCPGIKDKILIEKFIQEAKS